MAAFARRRAARAAVGLAALASAAGPVGVLGAAEAGPALVTPPATMPGAAPDRPTGDARRGAALAVSRSAGLCVLCHPVPGVPAAHQGNLAPDLAGAASRWSPEALRERLLHPERANPDTLMPAYGRIEGLHRVAPARRGQPLLDAQQIEDVLAWLGSLR